MFCEKNSCESSSKFGDEEHERLYFWHFEGTDLLELEFDAYGSLI
jgi:hypothetical protein